jgi:hypothetical protein
MKWYELNPERMAIEKRLLAEHHRGVVLTIKHGRMHVIKPIRGRYSTYTVQGTFADEHPYAPMQFVVVKPPLRGTPPHRFMGGQLCLHGPGDVGPETTAKIYVDWAEQWIQTYEDWLDGKPWPPTNRG